jgi:signal transduction histidine kinase
MVTTDNNPIDPAEYKKITEAMYKQNLELARLYKQVDTLNKQRESLVHLINHKVKGSFTRTKYIFVGILDGTYGEVSTEIKKVAEQGLEFDNGGIQTVDLVLNVANLQNGLIKYDMKNVDLKDILLKTTEDEKAIIKVKGLELEVEIQDGVYNVTGDALWLKEAIRNLITNSVTYTNSGRILVSLEKRIGQPNEKDKILLSVKDTGMGITEDDKKNLFTEGGRGKDSVKINVDSTGYGLYSVKLIVDAHNGRVWAESEGLGKGSTFFVELPAA